MTETVLSDVNVTPIINPHYGLDQKSKQAIDYYTKSEFIDLFHKYDDWYKNYKHLGRNDVCTCGSNKKYKKCCISKFDHLNLIRFSKLAKGGLDMSKLTEDDAIFYFNLHSYGSTERNDFGEEVEIRKILF